MNVVSFECLYSSVKSIAFYIILSHGVPLLKSDFSSLSEFFVGLLVVSYESEEKSYP